MMSMINENHLCNLIKWWYFNNHLCNLLNFKLHHVSKIKNLIVTSKSIATSGKNTRTGIRIQKCVPFSMLSLLVQEVAQD
jgi:hypothetical protein